MSSVAIVNLEDIDIEPAAAPDPSPPMVHVTPDYAWECLDIYPPAEEIAKALQDVGEEKIVKEKGKRRSSPPSATLLFPSISGTNSVDD